MTLSGTNTFTGGVNIGSPGGPIGSGGTLTASNVSALGSTTNLVSLDSSNAVLQLATDTGFGGANPVYAVYLGNNTVKPREL